MTEKPDITEKEMIEMYRILVQIYEALNDRKGNSTTLKKLNCAEICWYLAIDDLLNRIDKGRQSENVFINEVADK